MRCIAKSRLALPKKWEQERIPNSMQRAYNNPLNNLDEFGACQGANALPLVWKLCVSESGWNCSALFSPATASAFPSFWIFPVRVVPRHPNVNAIPSRAQSWLLSHAGFDHDHISGKRTQRKEWLVLSAICLKILKKNSVFSFFSWLPDWLNAVQPPHVADQRDQPAGYPGLLVITEKAHSERNAKKHSHRV